ncbi:MAG: hypothetical protein ACREFY_13790, partial [Acetobacteraceae bacterium]
MPGGASAALAEAFRGTGHARPPAGLLIVSGAAALLVLVPIVWTAGQAVTVGIDDGLALLFRPLIGELLLNTLALVAATT